MEAGRTRAFVSVAVQVSQDSCRYTPRERSVLWSKTCLETACRRPLGVHVESALVSRSDKRSSERSSFPDCLTQADQGGGGPISIDEMKQALLLFSDEPVWEKAQSATLTVLKLTRRWPALCMMDLWRNIR